MKETNQRTDGLILLVKAVELVANQIYPQEIPRIAKNKARGLIRTAVKQGALKHKHNANKIYLRNSRFEQWAARKWPKLATVFNLPEFALYAQRAPPDRNPKRRLLDNIPVFDPNSIRIPAEHDKLRKLYLRSRQQLMYTKWHLSHCQSELNEFLTRDAAQRKKKSKAGKMGKGVPRRRQ